MVTGQSMVLWSRIHLVLRDDVKLRILLWMIIVNAIIFHVPTTVLNYGANSANPERFIRPYAIYEKVQVSGFFIQELILSSFYIGETIKLAQLQSAARYDGRRSRRLMVHLIVVNVVLIILDVTILGLEYADLYGYQTAWKGLVYSVKLKMEFTILNRLKEMTTGHRDSSDPVSNSDQTNARRRSLETTQHRWEMNDFQGRMATIRRNVPGILYEAYARGGNQSPDDLETQDQSYSSGEPDVVLTTEVVVRTKTRSESEIDLGESKMNRFNAGVAEATSSSRKGSSALSKSSSELRLTTHSL